MKEVEIRLEVRCSSSNGASRKSSYFVVTFGGKSKDFGSFIKARCHAEKIAKRNSVGISDYCHGACRHREYSELDLSFTALLSDPVEEPKLNQEMCARVEFIRDYKNKFDQSAIILKPLYKTQPEQNKIVIIACLTLLIIFLSSLGTMFYLVVKEGNFNSPFLFLFAILGTFISASGLKAILLRGFTEAKVVITTHRAHFVRRLFGLSSSKSMKRQDIEELFVIPLAKSVNGELLVITDKAFISWGKYQRLEDLHFIEQMLGHLL